jgi:hypothetical protein
VNKADPADSGRIPAEVLQPDRLHGRGCLCITCGTADHPLACGCFWCDSRRRLERQHLDRLARKRREPVPTDEAAEHVAELGLTRRELAAAVGCSVGTASRLSRPGEMVGRGLVERVLAL